MMLKILIVPFFSCHRKMRENPVFHHHEAFYNELFLDFVPLREFFTEFLIVRFRDGQQFYLCKSLYIPTVGLIEEETHRFRNKGIRDRNPLGDFLSV